MLFQVAMPFYVLTRNVIVIVICVSLMTIEHFPCASCYSTIFWGGMFIKNVLYILVIIFKFLFLCFNCFYMLWVLNNRFCKYFHSGCCSLFILKDILTLIKYFPLFKKKFHAFCVTSKKSLPMIRSWRLFFLCLPVNNFILLIITFKSIIYFNLNICCMV